MLCRVTHADGRVEEFNLPGENFALGMAHTKHTCICGESEFVDGGDIRNCPCGRKLEYFDDEDERTGYLHQREEA